MGPLLDAKFGRDRKEQLMVLCATGIAKMAIYSMLQSHSQQV